MLKRTWIPLLIFSILASFVALWPHQAVTAQTAKPLALVMTADGPLTPAMREYLERALHTAEQRGAEVLVMELNTPGGSIDLMNQMVQDIRGSQVPVVIYIAPHGAMAGSAGTLITLAGQVAAMAPETTIGAASPVGPGGQDLGQTLEAKEKNILTATVRSLASRRNPQAVSLAEDMIQNAKAASAKEALDAGLVDFIASDINDLLNQMDGFQVQINGQSRNLHTTGAEVEELPPTLIESVLNALTDPNVVLILMNLGVAAILIEISHPGGWIAGFIGVVSLALAGYGLDILPVNWFGIIFMVLAFILFILDIKAPTHGALTAAGVLSLTVGALVLFNTPSVPRFTRVSVPIAAGSSLITGGMFFTILIFALRARHAPIRTGQEALLGRIGTVSVDLNPRGQVKLGGESWTAEPAEVGDTLPKGTRVQVVGLEGLKLLVRRTE